MATGNAHKKILEKFGRVVFELRERTDKQTDKSYGTMRHVRSGKNGIPGRCAAEHRPLARPTVQPSQQQWRDRQTSRQTEWNDNKAHSLRCRW